MGDTAARKVWQDERCSVCGGGFSERSWDDRCTDPRDGLSDCHKRCCPQCNATKRKRSYKLSDSEAALLLRLAQAYGRSDAVTDEATLRKAIESLEKGRE